MRPLRSFRTSSSVPTAIGSLLLPRTGAERPLFFNHKRQGRPRKAALLASHARKISTRPPHATGPHSLAEPSAAEPSGDSRDAPRHQPRSGPRLSEHPLPFRQNLVERVPKIRGAPRHLQADLLHVLLPRFLELVLEQLLQPPVPQPPLLALRMISRHIGDQGPGQASRSRIGVELAERRARGPRRRPLLRCNRRLASGGRRRSRTGRFARATLLPSRLRLDGPARLLSSRRPSSGRCRPRITRCPSRTGSRRRLGRCSSADGGRRSHGRRRGRRRRGPRRRQGRRRDCGTPPVRDDLEDATAHRAPRTHAVGGDLPRIDPENRLALRTRGVHGPSLIACLWMLERSPADCCACHAADPQRRSSPAWSSRRPSSRWPARPPERCG